MSVEEILRYAFERFDEYDYDNAVKAFMAAYHASSDEQQKKDIFEVINENFIEPNEEIFREAYYNNLSILSQKGNVFIDNIPKFEELRFALIPISEEIFYVWDRINLSFCGSKPLDITILKSRPSEKTYNSILIDGFSDIRMMINEIQRVEYANIYIVLRDTIIICEFFSFFVVPGLLDDFQQLYIFDRPESLMSFLYETGNYIPGILKLKDAVDYAVLFADLHNRRIHEPKKNSPLLSIGIPTYNRAKFLCRWVMNLLDLFLDEEIEIVIANNSTEENIGDYNILENIAKVDSRLNYKVFPPKSFCYSIQNIFSMPNGKFAIFSADKDEVLVEQVYEALDFLWKHGDEAGLFCFGAQESDGIYYKDSKACPPGVAGIMIGFGMSKLAGICFNMDLYRKEKILEKIGNNYCQNEYYKMYAHTVHAGFLGWKYGYGGYGGLLIKCGDAERSEFENGEYTWKYQLLEERLKQYDDEMSIVMDMNLSFEAVCIVALNFQTKIYNYLWVAYYYHKEYMESLHNWEECCQIIYEYCLDFWRKMDDKYHFVDMSELLEKVKDDYEEYLKKGY
ncbi:glycosyltransferase [Butyrivibrio sp. JL13D10]|uniref:glycosyltransferase n=1 Tax=Butyrivibrio sp. JL13D10 TaxID=3236815 RepID=UPI0038B62F50